MDLLVVVLSGFALAAAAPLLQRVLGGKTGWVLALLPFGLFAWLLSMAPAVSAGRILTVSQPWAAGTGLTLDFRLDGLGLVFALLITGIGAVVVSYSGGYLAGRSDLGRFYLILLMFMASMLGVVLAGNLLLVYVFWELTSITSFLLIGFEHEEEASRKAALQALLVTTAGGLAMLAGIVILGNIAGGYAFSTVFAQSEAIRSHPLYGAALAAILLGAFTKSAQFPFHFWLPNAMVAPTPVSAYLHAATMVKAGIYLIARLNPVLGGTTAWFAALTAAGGVTMLLGAVLALCKKDLKQILAYTTLSVLGMLTFLVGLGTPHAIEAMVVYLVAHALYKGTLFLAAGSIDHETGTRDIGELGGLRRFMPFTAAAAGLAALSMAGFPPFIGFLGKELAYEAGRQADVLSALLTAVLIATSVLLVAAAATLALRPFFGSGPRPIAPQEAPVSMWLGPSLLAGCGLLLGVAPSLFDGLASAAVAAATGAPAAIHLVVFHGFNVTLLLGVLTLAAGLILFKLLPRISMPAIWPAVERWGPSAWYETALNAMTTAAVVQTRFLQSGYLRLYLLTVMAALFALGTFALLARAEPVGLPEMIGIRIYEGVLALLTIVAAITAVRAASRMTTVASLSVVGIGVTLFFALLGAPDLAMTQFAVETLILILLVLVLYHVPDLGLFTGQRRGMRDLVVAGSLGGLMGALVLAVSAVDRPPGISSYFLANSYPLAHGSNVVNVILTDFRALDTLGEITVLAVAAVGVFALLHLFPRRGEKDQ